MSQNAILAGIGVDRPGIVNDVSKFLFERGCSIVDSHLANLRGAASFMMVVTAEDGNVEKLHADLAALVAETSMACSLLPATPVSDTPPVRGTPYRLLSRGKDQAGVVPRLSHLLRVMSVNIEKLRIDTPRDAKEPCFELNLLLSVPRETPISALREYLAHLCGEIGITCDLSPA